MSDSDGPPKAARSGAKTPPATGPARRARQAEALRANLKRRKEQARERGAATPPPDKRDD